MVFSKWPRPRGAAKSAAQQTAQDAWAYNIQAMKYFDGLVQDLGRQASQGTPLLPRDVLMLQFYNRAFWFRLPDGRKVFSMAAMQDVSLLLDTFTQTRGGLLWRDSTLWKGLEPGNPDDVLKLDAEGLPHWGAPGVAGTVQTILSGAVLNQGSLDIDLNGYQSSAPHIEIFLSNCIPAVDNNALLMRIGDGNPVTWRSGATDYTWASGRWFSSPGTNNQGATEQYVNIHYGNGAGGGNAEGLDLRVSFLNWTKLAQKARFMWDANVYTDNDLAARFAGSGHYNTAGAISGVRFFFNGGNIKEANWRVVSYG